MKKITSFEYGSMIWFLIRACFAEFTLSIILHAVREDTWISVIIGCIIGILIFVLFEYFKNRYPNDSIVSLYEKCFKTKYLNIITIIGIYIMSICSFWILARFTSSLFLFKTSIWTISIALIIPIGYACSKGINVIGKVSLILFYISFIFNVLVVFGLVNGIDLNGIKPILQSDTMSMIYSPTLFIGLNITKLFFLTIIPKNQVTNYSTKCNFIFYIVTSLTLIYTSFSIICIFGIDLSLLYEYPAFQILKRVNILGVLDRLESILSLEALFSLFIQITLGIYFIIESIKEIFKVNKKTNGFICLTVFIISNLILRNLKIGEDFLSTYFLFISYFTCIIVPLICLFKLIKHSKTVKS